MIVLKSLLNAVTGRKQPSSESTESATQLARVLPSGESYTALIDVIKAITRINKDLGVTQKDRLQTLLYVDGQSASMHRQLCLEYLGGSHKAKSYLPTILAYWTELATGYLLCIRQFQSGKNPLVHHEIELATVRALHHQLSLIRWSALRHISCDGSTWLQAYRLYSFAEQSGFQNKPTVLYKHHAESVTAEQLLVQAAMLHLAQTDNLVAIEIEAIHLLLSRLVDGVKLKTNSSDSDFQYVINLELANAPQLLRRGTLGRGCRFWSGDDVVNRLADLILDFDQGIPEAYRRALPAMDNAMWRDLLQKLSTRWSQDGGKSMRKHDRISSAGLARVEIGFERIAHHLKISRATVASEGVQSDEWRVTDTSDTGAGLTYLGRAVDNLQIGRLIWFAMQEQPARLGILRRVQRLSEGGTKVGVEVLGTLPLPVQLSNDTLSTPASGLYITQNNTRDGSRVFLVPKKLPADSTCYTLTANGKSYQIRLDALQGQYEDCNRVGFETLVRL